MQCYTIEKSLMPCKSVPAAGSGTPYVLLLNEREWLSGRESLGFDIAFDSTIDDIFLTKAEVNYDTLRGTFCVPRRMDLSGPDDVFAFSLNERGIVFVDKGNKVAQVLGRIADTRKWPEPCMEHFLYDFLDQLVMDDPRHIEWLERELLRVEECILGDRADMSSAQVGRVRSDIRVLRTFYAQLQDLAEVLEQNENGFFAPERLRFFRLFQRKVERLRDSTASLQDYALQVRDLYKTHLDVRQNSIVTLLTVMTAIFTPLTLLTGWFGMNFEHMPELDWQWSYAVVIVVSLAIVAAEVAYFKRKRWL